MDENKKIFVDDVLAAYNSKGIKEFFSTIQFWGFSKEELLEKEIRGRDLHKKSRYKNMIYWAKLMFKDEIIEKLNCQCKDIIGIHIMPYRINNDIVKNAVKSTDNKRKFPEHNDYDVITGNYHTIPNGKYQVVLIIGGGPGWLGGVVGNYKNNYYFPSIEDAGNKECNDISTFINNALDAIGIKQTGK